ncbi:SpaH/EbpB family LPXTG-anchored major pilin [Gardnerella vaginalis]|uniref:SpaH/EbpB family LPXTG-anchored major pilin n=1 Tax=Gardnerella vaginalis TaxID=2702 RepID=UPI0039EFCB8A
MRLNKISLKQAVAMLAATCTLGTCCIAGSVAWAEQQPKEVNTANIDTDKKQATSITLHKYEGPESKTDQSDGTVKSGANKGDPLYGKKPVRGVVFKVWRVKKKAAAGSTDEAIDLSTSAGWEKIKDIENLSNGQAAATTSNAAGSSNSSTATTYTAEQLMTGTTAKYVKDETTVYTCTSGDDGSCKVGTTSGQTTTYTLPMGLYYIEETDTNNAEIKEGDGTSATWKKVSITKHVVPFFVTTPLPNPNAKDAAGAWIYDVNVYPKNDISKNRPNKEVEKLNRKDFEVGDNGTTITWKISVPLSAPQNGNKTYTQIGFVDKLTNGLAYKEIKSARIVTLDENGAKAKKNNTEITDVVLDAVDTANNSPKYYTVDSTTTTDVVKFTLKGDQGEDTGLAKALKAYNDTVENNKVSTNAKQTATLVVELVTKFKDKTQARDFKNMANTFVDDNTTGDPDNPCTPGDSRPKCKEDNTPTDDAYFGTLTVNKYVKQKATKAEGQKQVDVTLPLNDAKFDLYEVTSTNGATITKDTKFAQITDINNVTSITTKPDSGNGTNLTVKKVTHKGKAKSSDTQLSDLPTTLTTADSADKTKHGTASVSLFVKDKSSSDTKLYCVVETEAPKGYLLDSRPHCIQLAANATSTQGTTTTISIPAGNTLPVENKKATGMDQILAALPMTGARGLVILTLCGIVGLAGTFFYIVMKRRKEQEQA